MSSDETNPKPKANGAATPALATNGAGAGATEPIAAEGEEDGGADGGADEPESEGAAEAKEAPEEPLEAAPPAVAELAAACVRFVASRYGVMPDFTPDTLSLLDQYVRDARGELEARPETIDVVQGAVGAYLGEVMRRAFGGEWAAEGEPSSWRLYLRRVYLAFNPIGMVREALLLEPQEGWHAHLRMDPGERDAVEQRLASLGEVEDEEYYAPTTRYDVVELAYEALRAQMTAAGLADVRFGREDYEK